MKGGLKEQMKMKRVTLMIFVFVIFLISSISASTYTLSNPQYTQYYSTPISFDSSMCEAGQDFLIQIAPFGCTPAVVRSDLLEEQNIPVFCQLAATQINPLIDVEAIESISFTGEVPREVSGIGFYPAKAALGIEGKLNYPILENIGYVVIMLKRQKNESAMPDFIEGNLTAKIRYDIKKAFGVGSASFYLPELGDKQWEEKYKGYGFWEGKGFLRAENIEADSATISIYDKSLRRISSVVLKKGENSKDIIIPGFDFCQGTLNVKLDGIEAPNTRAKLKVNADVIEMAEGEKFLDNKCQVKKIEKQGLVQKVRIYCREDEKPRTFDLTIEPKIKLNIDGEEEEKGVGDFLYQIDDRYVYLGYIGTKGTEKLEDLFVFFVSMPEKRNLTEKEFSSINTLVKSLTDSRVSDVPVIDSTAEVFKKVGGLAVMIEKFIVEGKDFSILNYMSKGEIVGSKEIFGKNVEILGFAGVQDVELDKEILKYYGNASEDYRTIIESYPNEKYPENAEISLGEEALYQQIVLLEKLGQKKIMTDLCDEFNERYPKSEKNIDFCYNGYKLSNSELSTRIVTIDGKDREISFEDIYEPTFDDYGAEIWIRGPDKTDSFKFRKNQLIELSGFRELKDGEKEPYESVQLISLEEDSAIIKVNLVGAEKYFVSDEKKLIKDSPESFGEYTFILKEINLKKFAKVSLIPNIRNVGTEASFSFKIGIEKRAIKLTPEKIKEKIETLSDSIAKWEDISGKLDKIIRVERGACLATGAALTFKNLVENLKGEGIARQLVMRGKDGWYERCTDMVNAGTYVSQEQCLLKNANEIDKDVEDYYEKLNAQNEQIKKMQEKFTEKKILAEDVVNTDGFMKEYPVQVQDRLKSLGNILEDPERKEEAIDVDKMKETLTYDAWRNRIYDLEQLRDIELYTSILEKNPNDVRAQKRLYSLFSDVQKASGGFVERKSFLERYGFEEGFYGSTQELKEIPITKVKTFGEVKNKFSGIPIDDNNYVYPFKDKVDGKEYLIVLDDDYVVSQTYLINNGVLSVAKGEDINPLRIGFKKYDKKTYQNKYKVSSTGDKGAVIRYYETEPYKGFPAVVPFDLENGWYAATKQTLPVGRNIATFDASARVNSFWLCNVGENGIEEFYSGFGDDICRGINLGTGQPYNQFPWLEEGEAAKFVGCAVDAIGQASRAYTSGVSKVRISTSCGNINVNVGKPALDIPEIQCQDFMSPKECNLIFNVCDPVICPSSRCDFGGAYPVRDVIQTGVVGGFLLCLPNIREGIIMPVCLTGIQAGIDGWISIKKSYRDCLQNSLDTGQMTGICDEIYSIYLCEFFWNQALTLAKIAPLKITEFLLGQSVRGGGEYLSVQNAFEGAKGSVDYFTQYYGAESYKAFKARATEQIGTVVCKNIASLVTPKGADLFDKLLEPDSPPQFHGRFDEIPFTTVTVPPISHYKVFYHIFAGKNTGAYYSVYLKGGEELSFYRDVSPIRRVDSGYIPVGGYVSETKDFTAPSGYKQLCINVNGQEECGFKEVSTSFAVDYLEEQYLAEQAKKTEIKTEKECISGSASLYNLLNPNMQSAAQELINPEIYNRGIIRICATDNPGLGSDPYAGTENSRWMEVGYCDDKKIKCWIDTESVKQVINSPEVIKYLTEGKIETIEDAVLKDITQSYIDVLMGEEYLREEDFKSKINEIEKEESSEKKIELVNKVVEKVFFNHQKAYLLLLRGNAYGDLAREALRYKHMREGMGLRGEEGVEEEEEVVGKKEVEVEEEKIEIKANCQIEIGKRIIEIVNKERKEKYSNIKDEKVKVDTGAKNFECLVLQVAMQESSLRHCKEVREGDCLYCDGKRVDLIGKTRWWEDARDFFLGPWGIGPKESIGVMQINLNAHPDMKDKVAYFEDNVKYGIKLLNQYYNKYKNGEIFTSTDKKYYGWKAALRAYNGWGYNKDTLYYVEEVTGEKDKSNGENTKEEVIKLFPECGEEIEKVEEESIEKPEEVKEKEGPFDKFIKYYEKCNDYTSKSCSCGPFDYNIIPDNYKIELKQEENKVVISWWKKKTGFLTFGYEKINEVKINNMLCGYVPLREEKKMELWNEFKIEKKDMERGGGTIFSHEGNIFLMKYDQQHTCFPVINLGNYEEFMKMRNCK